MALSVLEWFIIIVLLVLPMAWKTSHKVRFYAKIVAYNVWVILCSACVLPVAIFRPGDVDNTRVVQWIMNKTSSIFGLSVEVRGIDNIKATEPRVFVGNHQSSLDVISLMRFLPPRTTAVMKRQLMYAGPFGLACWLCGMIFVDRSGKGQGHKVTEKTAKTMHERNVNVWIFPEGTRYYNDDILEFKKGAFYLAVQAKAPICPIVFSSYKNFLDKKGKVFNSGKIIVSCLPQVSTKGLTTDDVEGLTERVRNSMREEYKKISDELQVK